MGTLTPSVRRDFYARFLDAVEQLRPQFEQLSFRMNELQGSTDEDEIRGALNIVPSVSDLPLEDIPLRDAILVWIGKHDEDDVKAALTVLAKSTYDGLNESDPESPATERGAQCNTLLAAAGLMFGQFGFANANVMTVLAGAGYHDYEAPTLAKLIKFGLDKVQSVSDEMLAEQAAQAVSAALRASVLEADRDELWEHFA